MALSGRRLAKIARQTNCVNLFIICAYLALAPVCKRATARDLADFAEFLVAVVAVAYQVFACLSGALGRYGFIAAGDYTPAIAQLVAHSIRDGAPFLAHTISAKQSTVISEKDQFIATRPCIALTQAGFEIGCGFNVPMSAPIVWAHGRKLVPIGVAGVIEGTV